MRIWLFSYFFFSSAGPVEVVDIRFDRLISHLGGTSLSFSLSHSLSFFVCVLSILGIYYIGRAFIFGFFFSGPRRVWAGLGMVLGWTYGLFFSSLYSSLLKIFGFSNYGFELFLVLLLF